MTKKRVHIDDDDIVPLRMEVTLNPEYHEPITYDGSLSNIPKLEGYEWIDTRDEFYKVDDVVPPTTINKEKTND